MVGWSSLSFSVAVLGHPISGLFEGGFCRLMCFGQQVAEEFGHEVFCLCLSFPLCVWVDSVVGIE